MVLSDDVMKNNKNYENLWKTIKKNNKQNEENNENFWRKNTFRWVVDSERCVYIVLFSSVHCDWIVSV